MLTHNEEYETAGLEEEIKKYSSLMEKTGIYKGRGADGNDSYGWIEHTARRLASENKYARREHLKKELLSLGFGFD